MKPAAAALGSSSMRGANCSRPSRCTSTRSNRCEATTPSRSPATASPPCRSTYWTRSHRCRSTRMRSHSSDKALRHQAAVAVQRRWAVACIRWRRARLRPAALPASPRIIRVCRARPAASAVSARKAAAWVTIRRAPLQRLACRLAELEVTSHHAEARRTSRSGGSVAAQRAAAAAAMAELFRARCQEYSLP